MTVGTMLDLSAGSTLVLDGTDWTVEAFEPQFARVLLRRLDGTRLPTNVRFLVNHPRCQQSTRLAVAPAANRGRQPKVLQDLPAQRQEQVDLRVAHLLEVETGYRSGDPLRPGPDEPRPEYDPAITTLTQRRGAKVAELRAMRDRDPQHARMLALQHVSLRTLIRMEGRRRRFGSIGCADDRWLRVAGARPSITEPVREAILAVRLETLHRSRISMRARERLIHQYVREKFGPDAAVPCYETLRGVWIEWFGPGGARQRYVRSAAAAARVASGEHVVVHRPGQVVALDTTVLPVKVRETVFGQPVSVHLTLALDAYTHSLVAFRLTLVSDTSVDVAMLLRDVMMPLPLREGWGEDMEWPYPGIPSAVVAEFAGHRVAALPFFAPETVTTDHGSVYRNHHLVEVQRVIGVNILPSRVLRPTDKQSLERAFGGIRSLLFEHLLGYQGTDVADRGADPEGDAVLTVADMEHLIATWVIRIWQNRRLGEHAPWWDPGGEHSPNTLFAAAMAQGGFALQIPTPQLYYELLPAHYVTIHAQRGVKVRGLWYDGAALDPYRDGPSTRGGQRKGRWVIRRDPRDARFTFFQDPTIGDWHTLRWTGLGAEGEIPSFNDARVRELLAEARGAGLTPRSDAELLPLLLKLLGGHTPVEQWPTQLGKQQRKEHAREVDQAATADTDRPNTPEPSAARPATATVVPMRWTDRAAGSADAVDAERRRRREQVVTRLPEPPLRLGARLRARSLFILSTEDSAEDEPTAPQPGPDVA